MWYEPLIALLKAYWKPLGVLAIALIFFGYVGILKHKINGLKRDNASLQQTIDLDKEVGQTQNEKTARIEQGAHDAALASANQYLSDLEKVKKYNETHPVIKHIIDSVRQPATNSSSSQVSTAPGSSTGINADTADQVPSGSSLEDECRITTLMLLRLQDFERDQQDIH